MAELLQSPIADRHAALGAKTAEFGGWSMPVEYPGGGVLKEHAAVRGAVGLFDVSHLGKGEVVGDGAAAFVNTCLTNDLDRIGGGQAQYTLCCDELGGVVDDLIVYRHCDERLLLVPNAANTAEVLRRLTAAAPAGVSVTDLHTRLGVLAVQGPSSVELLMRLGLPTQMDYMGFADATVDGVELVVCRTGYTGEHGFELLPPWEATGAVWDALLAAGQDLGVRPCGLGARDTLRTEMGYPLHGHELSLDISPVQARSGWAVGWSKPAFWGHEALRAEKERGAARLLWGLRATDRGIPRPHMPVQRDGAAVGAVTSGTFSPTERVGIGLALLDRSVSEGDEVTVDVRGRTSVLQVVRPPFVPARTR